MCSCKREEVGKCLSKNCGLVSSMAITVEFVMDLFNTGIRPVLDDWLLTKSKEKRDYGSYWSASSAGYCMRKTIFERLGVPHVETDSDARKQRVFTAGHLFHDWIQQLTRESGLSIAQEVELQDEDLMIRGHFDDLILIESGHDVEYKNVTLKKITDSHLILYDYKTVNSRSFKYKKDGEMSFYHRMQLGTYMYMLRQRKTLLHDKYNGVESLSEARILSISKDDLRMDEKQLMWTPDLEKAVVGYWRTLNGYWKAKKIPKCTCADYEGGFLAKEAWNPFYFEDEPCSLAWMQQTKKDGLW